MPDVYITMLSGLLSREECAKCRICCCFDSGDIWEAPIISEDNMTRITDLLPQTQFEQAGESSRVIKMNREPDEDLYYCDVLDRKKGCMLGDEKPFDCRIWPLRVMSFEGKRVIALSPVCPVVKTRPLDKIAETAKRLAPVIFENANKNPDLVKPYETGYVILVIQE